METKVSEDNIEINQAIDRFKNAVETIDRDTLLTVAKTLNINHKIGAIIEKDANMSKKSGNNKSPKIINIDILFRDKKDIKESTAKAKKIAIKIYTNNNLGYITVNNIDTKTNYELGRKGINKTFSKNVPLIKLSTVTKLLEIGRQGIYYETSYDENDKQGIKYHHFLTPVKSLDGKGNAFIRSVIKEYTKDNYMNNKFYYHQFEYLDDKM